VQALHHLLQVVHAAVSMSLVLAAFCHHGSLVLLSLLYGTASIVVIVVNGFVSGVYEKC
jgi:hypothetical protein